MSASVHSPRRTSMNDVRRKEIQRALTLIGEAKGILELALSQEQNDLDNMPEDLQGDEEGQIAEDVVDALERAAMGCGDAITGCKEAMQGQQTSPTKCARSIGGKCLASNLGLKSNVFRLARGFC